MTLKRVSVSRSNLQFVLHNCKFLESLVLCLCRGFKTLKVCGPSLSLQHLEIDFCPVVTLIVSNVNLITLKIGSPHALVLKNVPRLVHVDILPGIYHVEEGIIRKFSCCFPKLEVLSLHLHPEKIIEFDKKLPPLPALKQLSLNLVLYYFKESIYGLTSFFRAAPNLERFIMKTLYPLKIITTRNLENLVKYNVQHLRVVEICEYRGHSIELELVKYFLENAISLEKVIVDPRYKIFRACQEDWFCDPDGLHCEAEITKEARRCAEEQLLGIMPPHVELHIR